MLITAFGAPTRFGRLGGRILKSLIAAQGEDSLFLNVNSPEELYPSLAGRQLRVLALFSTAPEFRLVQVARRLDPRCLVFYDDPEAVFSKAMGDSGYNPVEAARQATRYVSSMAASAASTDALVFRRGDETSLGDVIDAICAHFRLIPDRQAVLQAMSEAGDDFTDAESLPLWECARRLDALNPISEVETSAINVEHFDNLKPILAAFDELGPERLARPILWDRGLFFAQDNAFSISVAPDGWQELLGPARYLYFGPYLHVPSGAWDLRASFRVRENNAGNKVDFDVFQAGECLAFGRFDLPRVGVFEVAAALYNSAPENPIEFRLQMKEGAIDGGIILDQVRWVHQDFWPPANTHSA